jgi:adenine/guanine phosphoribosyltransferase-like PRPP-binding protein
MSVDSQYLTNILDKHKLAQLVKRVKTKVKNIKFDGVAFQGMSGAIPGGAIAYLLKKQPILVRKAKPCDESHSDKEVEGDKKIRRYIIVDDFIATGTTLDNIINSIHRWNGAKCVGVYLYNGNDNDRFQIKERNLEALY